MFQFRFDNEYGRFVREMRESYFVDTVNKDPNFINGEFNASILETGNSFKVTINPDDIPNI